ncbi:MarR family winged helix-turn-helix transcriptional regulator [Fretibacter rubidus]|uniref:MarR family winged helix-turn-helix transcriptional regulator n=1 Tax=Fretibacter rubidus TaxID=570162 RepID=UPI00352B2319
MSQAFNLDDFLPYALNQAAVAVSDDFAKDYKSKYGLLRTEWRVLAHLGTSGPMTARQICDASKTHKTKISRAVFALEKRLWLSRSRNPNDRRQETLALTKRGEKAYVKLTGDAQEKTQRLREALGDDDYKALIKTLRILTG